MRAPIRLGVTLAAPGIALALASPGVGEAPPPGAAAVLVQVRERTATGLVLNTLGHIAVPILSEQDGDWTVEADGERYPARVVSRQKRYGFLILKVEREKPFAYGVLASKQGQLPGRYVLLARGDGGTPIETPGVTIRQVRRRIPEAGLDGSYYALSIPGDSAPDGSLLLDPATAEVHGVLLPPLQGSADRYAAFAASLAERAALQNVPLGAAELPRGALFAFADGRTASARLRQLYLGAPPDRASLQRARALDDWRRHSGFWINTLTSPGIVGKHGYLASISGVLYGVDTDLMHREWLFDNGYPVFAPPSPAGSRIVCTSGDLALTAWQEDAPSLLNLLGVSVTRTRRIMVDHGYINCVERSSGAYKWVYRTRFLSNARVVGDEVVFAGMGALGVLNLEDGKEVWKLDIDRGDTTPDYYVLGGADAERLWVLATKVAMQGKGVKADPYRLEMQGSPSRVECHSLKARMRLWATPIPALKDAPALSGMMILAPDQKTCYGATAKDMFAVDAETGALRWQKPVFARFFGGNLSFGDRILFATSSDSLMYAVDPADGNVLWSFNGARAPLCVPLAHEGTVYVGSLDTTLYALDARSGRVVWKFETGGKICGQPHVVGQKLYCTSDDGRLTEIELPQ